MKEIPLISFEDDADAYYKAAHDIKGVSNRILSLVQIFVEERQGLSTEQNMYLDLLHKEANTAARLTTDYMALCKIKYLYQDSIKTTLKDALHPILPKLQQLAQERKVELLLEDITSDIFANPKIIEQLLFAVIQNGILYSDVQKSHRWVKLTYDSTTKKMTIEDNGIGIPEEKIDAVFKPFFRYHYDLGTELSTGIGLAMVREIVYRHQGKIFIDSKLNLGTTIQLYLPNI